MRLAKPVLLALFSLIGTGCLSDSDRDRGSDDGISRNGGTHDAGIVDAVASDDFVARDGGGDVGEGTSPSDGGASGAVVSGDNGGATGDGGSTSDAASPAEGSQEGDEHAGGGVAAYVAYDIAYGSDAAQRLDVYVPAAAQQAAMVVYVHGGAWALGSKSNVGAKASLINDMGMVFVSVEYRLSPAPASTDPNRVMHPDHVDDVTAAISYVANHAADFGGDAARIGLMGHSAGAHLVALAASDPTRAHDAVKCVFANDTEALNIPLALQTASAQQTSFYQNAFGTDSSTHIEASPITHVSSLTPPFLLTRRGAADRQAILQGFVDTLNGANISSLVIDARGLTHAEVDTRIGNADDDILTPIVVSFFDDCLN